MPYDKSTIDSALQDPSVIIEKSENEHGSFLTIRQIFYDENGNIVSNSHLLQDSDFDGIYDSYQFSIFDGKTRKFFNDDEFDGIFDCAGTTYFDENDEIILSAIDSDADGKTDYYERPLPKSTKNNI